MITLFYSEQKLKQKTVNSSNWINCHDKY